MAYDEGLAQRVANIFESKNVTYKRKKMIGGLCFMVDDKMVVGIMQDALLARVDPILYSSLLKKKDCGPMKLGGTTMDGYVRVGPSAIASDDSLLEWLQLCLDFNPKAKASKKRK